MLIVRLYICTVGALVSILDLMLGPFFYTRSAHVYHQIEEYSILLAIFQLSHPSAGDRWDVGCMSVVNKMHEFMPSTTCSITVERMFFFPRLYYISFGFIFSDLLHIKSFFNLSIESSGIIMLICFIFH